MTETDLRAIDARVAKVMGWDEPVELCRHDKERVGNAETESYGCAVEKTEGEALCQALLDAFEGEPC